ncbi:MAG: response regulator [Desulfobacterales bacterium]|nr:response regulator [Desulfobacterales bacterium]
MNINSQHRILIVDDDQATIRIIANLLKDSYEVMIATNGHQAFQLIQTSPHPDLILLDLEMPEMNGFEVLIQLKDNPLTKSIPVIIITSHDEQGYEAELLRLGAVDYINKPITPEVMIARICTHIKLKMKRNTLEKLIKEHTQELENTNAILKAEIQLRKNIEMALRQSELRFRDISYLMGDWIWEVDIAGKYTFIAGKTKAILGYNPNELLGTSMYDIMDHDDALRLQNILEQLFETKQPIDNFVKKMIASDQKHIHCTSNILCFYDENNEKCIGFRGIDKDISEFVLIQSQWELLQKDIRNFQKSQAIGTLAAGIAHDFNNLLFPMLGYAEMVQDQFQKQSDGFENMKALIDCIKKASAIVDQILIIGRTQEMNFQPVVPQPVIIETLKFLRTGIPKTVDIIIDISTEPSIIRSDPSQLHQIIMNLCINAYHSLEDRPGWIKISYTVDTTLQSCCLSIEDNGRGIPPEILERIFEPYFTTKKVGKGNGIGLAIVESSVKSHGGKIKVTSEVNKGSRFDIIFPLTTESDLPKQVTVNKNTLSDNCSKEVKHILVVDDEPEVLKMIEKMLIKLGYQVTAVDSSIKALNLFKSSPDVFDILLTDLMMPQMNGYQLIEAITALRPKFPTVVITGYQDIQIKNNLMQIGIKNILSKPITRLQLTKTLNQIFAT